MVAKLNNSYIDLMGHVVMPGDRCAVMHNFYSISGTKAVMEDMIYVGKRRQFHTFIKTDHYREHGEGGIGKYEQWKIVRTTKPERFGICVEEKYAQVTEPVKAKAGK